MMIDIAPSPIQIREGRGEDWPVLRLLLPDAIQAGADVATLLAEDANGIVHAALAIQKRLRRDPLPGMHVAIEVIPPSRRRILEHALLQTAIPWAKSRGARALYAWGAIDENSPAEKSWRQLGFDQSAWLQEGRVDPAAVIARLNHAWRELQSRNRIPKQAKVVSLAPAHIATLLKMHLDNFGGNPETIRDLFTPESPTALDPRLCAVLLLHDEIIGYVFAVRTGNLTARVDATFIAKAHRSSWANVWLKRDGAARCVSVGIKELLFYTYGRHNDTRRFTSQIGVKVRSLVEPYRILE